MPWISLIKFGLPLALGIGVIFSVHAHFKTHLALKLSNAELSAAVVAKDKANAELRSEINKRDSIIARRDVAYGELSRSIRMVKSAVTQSKDADVISWGNTALPGVVISSLRQAGDSADSGKNKAAADPDE